MPKQNYIPVYGLDAPAGTSPDSPNSGRTKWNNSIRGLEDAKLTASDLVDDYVASGLLPTVPSPASLTMSTPAGVAYVLGTRVSQSSEGATYTAARDTYVDLSNAGVYTYSPVANGAAAPAIAPSSIRLFRVVADAAAITGVTDLRDMTPAVRGGGAAHSHPEYARILGDPADGQHFAWSEVDGMLVPVAAPSGGGASSVGVVLDVLSNVQTQVPNVPAAFTEFFLNSNTTHNRTGPDLSGVSQARVVTHVIVTAGNATAEMRAQYSSDSGATWRFLDGASGPGANLSLLGMRKGAWVDLEAAARADVILRVGTQNGDGISDPGIARVQVQAR